MLNLLELIELALLKLSHLKSGYHEKMVMIWRKL